MRIGIGYDIHRFEEGRKLFLGGIEIPHVRGLLGHSDADVLIHAVCDALFGAAGMDDIGFHFSDSDPQYKDISSVLLLSETIEKIRRKGFQSIINLDVTLFAEEPKIGPYRSQMKQNIAQILGVDPDRVNIKATTAEKLGAIGRGEGVGAMAAVLIE